VPGAGRFAWSWRGAPASRTIERMETELGWEFIQIYGLPRRSRVTVNRAQGMDELDVPTGPASEPGWVFPPPGVRVRVDEQGEVWPAPTTSSPAIGTSPEESGPCPSRGLVPHGDGGFFERPSLVISDRRGRDYHRWGDVSSIEVEDCLYQHPAVDEVRGIGVPDETWGETIKALVVSAMEEGR